MTAAQFEWRGGLTRAAWLWVPLMGLLGFGWPLFPMPLPERGLPIFWLLLAGVGMILGIVARVSWPAAALLAWALLRLLWWGPRVDVQSLNLGLAVLDPNLARQGQLIVLLLLVGVLYAVARELPERGAAWVAWALMVPLTAEVALGYLNLWRWYPWMAFVLPQEIGRPMGVLTHTNYWGNYVALALPIAWALGGVLVAAALYAMLLASWSGGPVIAASVGVGLLLWPRLGRRMRYLAIAGGAAAVSVVMTVHEWRLSGRREVWAAVWPELTRYPWIGQGLGNWRLWADGYNAKETIRTGRVTIFATLQAHNEPYQLWFELGLIGLALAGLWALQAWLAARHVWRNCPGGQGAWWQPGWIPLERAWVAVLVIAATNALGSPTFHLPAQAGLVIFALARLQALTAAATPPLGSPVAPPARRRRKDRLYAHAGR